MSDPKTIPCRHADGGNMYMDHFLNSEKYRFQARIHYYWYTTWVSDSWTRQQACTQACIDFMLVAANKPSEAHMSDDIKDTGPLP